MADRSEAALRADIVEIGRRLHARAYVASNDGNISVRVDAARLLTTPTGVSKGFMTPDMMVITDLSGRKLAGEREPSSELLMHLEVYRNRPEVNAVVHAHPPVATANVVLPVTARIRGVNGIAVPLTDRVLAHPGDRVRPARDAGLAGGERRVADQLGPAATPLLAPTAFPGTTHNAEDA